MVQIGFVIMTGGSLIVTFCIARYTWPNVRISKIKTPTKVHSTNGPERPNVILISMEIQTQKKKERREVLWDILTIDINNE